MKVLFTLLIFLTVSSCDTEDTAMDTEYRHIKFITEDITYLSNQLQSKRLTAKDREVYVECMTKLNNLLIPQKKESISGVTDSVKTAQP